MIYLMIFITFYLIQVLVTLLAIDIDCIKTKNQFIKTWIPLYPVVTFTMFSINELLRYYKNLK